MILRHATKTEHLSSIQRDGLLPSHSQGKCQTVWTTAYANTAYNLQIMVRQAGNNNDPIIATISTLLVGSALFNTWNVVGAVKDADLICVNATGDQ